MEQMVHYLRSYSHQKVTELKEIFSLFDTAGDGYISMDDMRRLAVQLDCSITDDIFEELLKECQFENLTTITFPQFYVLIDANSSRLLRSVPSEGFSTFIRAFEYFDPEQTGFMKEEEFIGIMKGRGNSLSETEIQFLKMRISETGLLNNGMVNYRGFMDLISRQDNDLLKTVN